MQKYINIKGKDIPIIVREYRNSDVLKVSFKGRVLQISKPYYMPDKSFDLFLKKHENKIYDTYLEIISSENSGVKNWSNGEKFMYKGIPYDVNIFNSLKNKLEIEIDEKNYILKITISNKIGYEDKKVNIDRAIKNILKSNTTYIISKMLPEISKRIKIEYSSYNVSYTTSRYGSCLPQNKSLNFSSRLIMLPQNVIESVIIHELCHIVHPNHSGKFYDLVKKYKPDYLECDKWLKENAKMLSF